MRSRLKAAFRYTGSLGVSIETEAFNDSHFDTIIVGGSLGPVASTPGTIAFVQRALSESRRVAAICTGAHVLAEAGILDGRRATTHWAHARDLQRRFPLVKMEEDRIFIVDGPVWTSAGMSAGIDLALSMVEADLGADIARRVSKLLVMHHRRAGGQPPAKAVENLRVEAARVMMEQGRHPIDVVANETGFADRERMRRAFLRAFGQPPQTMRRNARLEAQA